MSIGLKFVKKVDENWRDRITYIDGTPYNEEEIVEEKYDSTKSEINKIEKFIDNELNY